MHVIIWEFVVRLDRIHEFLSAYKPDGNWAQLFRLAAGYEGTELLQSTDSAEKFVTIDRWKDAQAYEIFQERFGPQYRSLDAQLEGLTLSETKLGTFVA